MKILHIAVHLGGGVGTVLRNWIKIDGNEHTILLLNRNYYGENQDNIHENLRYEYGKIRSYIESSDIVIIHFWNHPLLFEFLVRFRFPACRLCVWSHVSALHPPYVHTSKLINFSDRFVLSSPVSKIEGSGKELDFIWTTGGIKTYLNTTRKLSDKNFVVGYVGTLDYTKLHRDFIKACNKIYKQVPNIKFIVCGEGNDKETIENEVKDLNLERVFEFVGRVDVVNYMPTFHVFGYPLANTHFGTCEQVLGEALACGVQPVVLNNPAESYILDSVGIVSSGMDDYVANIVALSKQEALNIELLRNRAVELYDIGCMIDKWNRLFDVMILTRKVERSWTTGYDIFVESVGKYGDILRGNNKSEIKELLNSNEQWKSECKGGLVQYINAFPEDKKLKELTMLL